MVVVIPFFILGCHKMTVHSGFEIPRFVALLGHFALLLILLWDVEAVARSSVSWSKRDDHHLLELAQNSITGALAMALTLVTVELTCFMIGKSKQTVK